MQLTNSSAWRYFSCRRTNSDNGSAQGLASNTKHQQWLNLATENLANGIYIITILNNNKAVWNGKLAKQ